LKKLPSRQRHFLLNTVTAVISALTITTFFHETFPSARRKFSGGA
jgi:hypothetical protein